MLENENRILAIDFGTKRIGLALTDPMLTFAYPYQTVLNDNKLWQNMQKVFDEMSISKIILGYPLKESGEKSSSTLAVEQFHIELKEKFKNEIILWDERYTSVIAKENMMFSVNKKSKRKDKGILDQNSAAIILQEYLRTLDYPAKIKPE